VARRRCLSCTRSVSADAPDDERWCPVHRVILDRIYNELHPRKKDKRGWQSQPIPKSAPPPKPARGEIGQASRASILGALANGPKNGAELASAVGVPSTNRTYLRERAKPVDEGVVEQGQQEGRSGHRYTLTAESAAA
jgi:hypothetical protein